MDFFRGGLQSQQIQRSISLAADFLRLPAETYEMLEAKPGSPSTYESCEEYLHSVKDRWDRWYQSKTVPSVPKYR